MRSVLLAWLLVATLNPATARAQVEGQWYLEPGYRPNMVRLTLRTGEKSLHEGWSSDEVSVGQMVGLPPAAWQGQGTVVHFRIVRDAGTLACDGWFAGGKGSGHFSYSPRREFVTELRRRGIEAPSAYAQFEMTSANLGLDLVDELERQGYNRPSVDDLARMATHGVDLEYLRDLDKGGYRLSDPATLIRMRDHGVDPDFIASIARAREQAAKGDTVTHEDLKRQLGIE